MALAALIEEITAAHPRAYWLERLEANDIPCGPINNYEEVASDPHILARRMVVETDHPTLGRLRTLGAPVKLSETPAAPGRPAKRRRLAAVQLGPAIVGAPGGYA